jgi:acetyl-CoA synthetase
MHEFTWVPTPEQAEHSRLRGFLRSLEIPDLEALQDFARRHPDRFWEAAVDDVGVGWTRRFDQVLDVSRGIEWARFWTGGRLNLSVNAVDRWVATTPDQQAVVWEGDDGAVRAVTFVELADDVGRAAAALRALGVGHGDAVGLFLPMIPETVVLFLAVARLGAVACPLFSGYGAGAIVTRLADCEAKVLCAADGMIRRGKLVPMKPTADEAARALPALRHMLVVRRLDGTAEAVPMTPGRDHWYHDLVAANEPMPAADTASDDTMMLIYTSGTTGKPKGTVHVQGGFPVKATLDMAHCFDVRAGDRLLWLTDLGWMMGPWAICGALTLGATLVIYEGTPDHPGPDRLWQVAARHGVTILGVAPTVVRALMRHGVDPVRSWDLSRLRVLGASGEPWNPDPWSWFLDEVGRGQAPIINYSGGTEISGGILAGNLMTPMDPCAFSGPCPGMDADVVDDTGRPVRGSVGELVVRRPWPGMTQGFWRDPERYVATYWSRLPGLWVHGDWAEIDQYGQWYIRGRSDDTIKVAGKRLGPAEVESVLVSNPAVAEAAAIGVPDPVKGEALVAFVVLRPGVEDGEALRGALATSIADSLGRALAPNAVHTVRELPKTRNAKVLRRVVRAVYLGNDPGDLSSLENKEAIDAIGAAR